MRPHRRGHSRSALVVGIRDRDSIGELRPSRHGNQCPGLPNPCLGLLGAHPAGSAPTLRGAGQRGERRYVLGALPVMRWNTWARCEVSAKPRRAAIDSSFSSVCASRSWAIDTRTRVR